MWGGGGCGKESIGVLFNSYFLFETYQIYTNRKKVKIKRFSKCLRKIKEGEKRITVGYDLFPSEIFLRYF